MNKQLVFLKESAKLSAYGYVTAALIFACVFQAAETITAFKVMVKK